MVNASHVFRYGVVLAAALILNAQVTEAGNAPRIVNFVNFARYDDYRISDSEARLYDATVQEMRLAREHDIPATFLIQYDVLVAPEYQKLFKEQMQPGWELGAWWEITRPHALDAGLEWPLENSWEPYSVLDFSIGYTQEERAKLVDTYMEKFHEIWGCYPKAVGSWYMDSYTLDYMRGKYGVEACCICKDQIGTDGYTLWGGYWNQAYYPSKTCLYMPAQTPEGQIDVPVFRMLGSDPIYQYNCGLGKNGQGVVSLEPVYREGGAKREWLDYFFDSMTSQPCLAFAYAQTGQENSFTWSKIGPGLEIQIPMLDSLRKAGTIRIETLGETGRWFHDNYSVTPATAVTALDDLRDEGRKAVWYDSRFYRARMFWNAELFCVQDIHVFDESFVSPFHSEPATGREYVILTEARVDGFSWSLEDDLGGLYIILPDGSRYTFDDPSVHERTRKGRLVVKSGDRRFKIVCDERQLQIKGRVKGWKPVIHNAKDAYDTELPTRRGILKIEF